MRHLAMALMLVSTSVWADATGRQFDPVEFEKRFHAADQGNKGKLSRKEAYAEFPRMPEFFDEIDTNKDGFITLKEVHDTMERRVNAAMDASKPSSRYGNLDSGNTDAGKKNPDVAGKGAGQQPAFTSEAEERRYRRMEFYEKIEGQKDDARSRGEPVPKEERYLPSSPILIKPF
jgi:hypothetical protein